MERKGKFEGVAGDTAHGRHGAGPNENTTQTNPNENTHLRIATARIKKYPSEEKNI